MGLFGNDTPAPAPAAAAAAAPAPAVQPPVQAAAPAPTPQQQTMPPMPAAGGMNLNPNLLSGLGSTSSGHSTEYAKAGRYLYRLDTVEMKPDRGGVTCFIPQFTVVHIFSVEGSEPSHKLGELVSSVSKQNSDYFKRDIKKILTTAYNVSDEEVGEADGFAACGYNPNGTYNGIKPMDGQYITIEVNNVSRQNRNDPSKTYVITNYHGAKTGDELLRTLTPEAISQFYTQHDGTCVLTPQA